MKCVNIVFSYLILIATNFQSITHAVVANVSKETVLLPVASKMVEFGIATDVSPVLRTTEFVSLFCSEFVNDPLTPVTHDSTNHVPLLGLYDVKFVTDPPAERLRLPLVW